MPVDQQDLKARIAAATAGDTVRGLIFNALFDTVEEHAHKASALMLFPDVETAARATQRGVARRRASFRSSLSPPRASFAKSPAGAALWRALRLAASPFKQVPT